MKNVIQNIAILVSIIITPTDADLQDDPKEIINFIKKIKEGNDLVSGWKKNRKDPISKTIPSKIYNSVLRFLFKIKLNERLIRSSSDKFVSTA